MIGVSRAFALPLASLAFGSCATDAPVAATPRADAALLSVTGSIGADAPKLRIREQLVHTRSTGSCCTRRDRRASR